MKERNVLYIKKWLLTQNFLSFVANIFFFQLDIFLTFKICFLCIDFKLPTV